MSQLHQDDFPTLDDWDFTPGCAFDECKEPGYTEVQGSELGLPSNTSYGGTVVCDEHAAGLRRDLSEMGQHIVEQMIAPELEATT